MARIDENGDVWQVEPAPVEFPEAVPVEAPPAEVPVPEEVPA